MPFPALAVSALAALLSVGPAGPAGPAAAAADPPSLLDAFSARDLDGRTWDREALAGKVVVLDFWATWCAPCLAELSHLRRVHARHAGEGAVVLGVCLDAGDSRTVRSWLRRHRVTWPQVHDGLGFDGPHARAFRVESVPRSLLFDREGRLVAVDLRGESLEAAIASLVAVGSPAVRASRTQDRAR